jgi:membrane protein
MPKLPPRLRATVELFKQTAQDWSDDNAARLAASLSFYAAISIAPMLLVIIAIVGFVFGEDAAQGAIMGQLEGILGPESAATVQSMVEGAARPRSGVLATLIGVVVLLFGASGVFGELQSAMNVIWEVKPKPGRGIFQFFRERFLSLTMVFGSAFLLMVSLVISAVLTALGSIVIGRIPGAPLLWFLLGHVVPFLVITLLFAMIFKVLPDVKIRYRDVWIGALFTSAMFLLGKLLVGMYIARANVATTYGAAGSVVVMLLWIYYSSQIFFFGAEFTQTFARLHGSRLVPTARAMPVPDLHGSRHREDRPGGLATP